MAFPVQIVGAPGYDAYARSRDLDLMVMLTNWERHWADGESRPVARPCSRGRSPPYLRAWPRASVTSTTGTYTCRFP